jgi:RNA polymerase sigma factor (sigma-70 family)
MTINLIPSTSPHDQHPLSQLRNTVPHPSEPLEFSRCDTAISAETAPETTAAESGDPLTRYLDQAGRWPRLEAVDELRLGWEIKLGTDAAGNRDAAAQAAFDLLVCSNLRLAYHAASQTHVRREELMELISAGNQALLEAARNYDAALGNRFSTYAYWGIRSAVMGELNFLRRTVRLPRNIHEQMSKLRKTSERLRQAKGAEPTDAELARELGCSPEKLTELQCLQQCGQSMDAPIGEEGGDLTFGDSLRDEHAVDPALAALLADDSAFLQQLLAGLTAREADVIRRRHGLNGEIETLEAIGQQQGVSRERIRQIEETAMRKLGQAAQAQHSLVSEAEPHKMAA